MCINTMCNGCWEEWEWQILCLKNSCVQYKDRLVYSSSTGWCTVQVQVGVQFKYRLVYSSSAGWCTVWSMRTGWCTVWSMRTGWSTVWSMRTGWCTVWSMRTGWSTVWSMRTGWSTVWSMRTGWCTVWSMRTGWSTVWSMRSTHVSSSYLQSSLHCKGRIDDACSIHPPRCREGHRSLHEERQR